MRNQRGTSGRGGGAPSVLQEGGQLFGVAGGREAGLAGADDGEGFIGREMGESLF